MICGINGSEGHALRRLTLKLRFLNQFEKLPASMAQKTMEINLFQLKTRRSNGSNSEYGFHLCGQLLL